MVKYMSRDMSQKKLCVIYNTAPQYREAIFRTIDAEYDCDWYFGETKSDIKEMDTSLLKNVKYYKSLGDPNKIYWKRGVLKLLFKKEYQNFFMLAEVRSITDWLFFWLALKFFPNKRIYLWTHGWYGKEAGIDAKMKLWLYRNVTGTFVYGDRAKKLLIEKGIDGNSLFTIHNSLDYEKQKTLRENIDVSYIYKEHFKNSHPTIIFIGRLTKVKKLDMLIEALAKLKKQGECYNLVFVGDGVERENLEKKTVDMQLQNNIWFYGACYDEKKNAELIYNADLCVSPGNVGLTAMHALVFGCPVITHDCFEWQMPEFEAIHAGATGDFFKKEDVNDLTTVISRWFSNKRDNRNEVRKMCFKEIDTYWNPYFQMDVIKKNLKLV